jgi:hypothetical protein
MFKAHDTTTIIQAVKREMATKTVDRTFLQGHGKISAYRTRAVTLQNKVIFTLAIS